jgi:hypothetical protein
MLYRGQRTTLRGIPDLFLICTEVEATEKHLIGRTFQLRRAKAVLLLPSGRFLN